MLLPKTLFLCDHNCIMAFFFYFKKEKALSTIILAFNFITFPDYLMAPNQIVNSQELQDGTLICFEL